MIKNKFEIKDYKNTDPFDSKGNRVYKHYEIAKSSATRDMSEFECNLNKSQIKQNLNSFIPFMLDNRENFRYPPKQNLFSNIFKKIPIFNLNTNLIFDGVTEDFGQISEVMLNNIFPKLYSNFYNPRYNINYGVGEVYNYVNYSKSIRKIWESEYLGTFYSSSNNIEQMLFYGTLKDNNKIQDYSLVKKNGSNFKVYFFNSNFSNMEFLEKGESFGYSNDKIVNKIKKYDLNGNSKNKIFSHTLRMIDFLLNYKDSNSSKINMKLYTRVVPSYSKNHK